MGAMAHSDRNFKVFSPSAPGRRFSIVPLEGAKQRTRQRSVSPNYGKIPGLTAVPLRPQGTRMKTFASAALGIMTALLASIAAAQVTLYKQEGFHGPPFSTNNAISNLDRYGFNDRASSAIVERGTWQMCEDSDFRGRCIVLRPGQYPTLGAMGFSNRISSLRRVGGGRNYTSAPPPPPPAPPHYAYYPRPEERLYQANVVAVRAVTGPPEQRCWMEAQQGTNQSAAPGPGGAV